MACQMCWCLFLSDASVLPRLHSHRIRVFPHFPHVTGAPSLSVFRLVGILLETKLWRFPFEFFRGTRFLLLTRLR